jgi:salicylate hydroxylase
VVHATSEAETGDVPGADLLERVRRETATWHELVPRIVGAAVPETVGVRGYYDKDPIAHARNARVWMIGDSAHPMSPFQGQGANMAIMDAVRLAKFFGGGAADGQRAAEVEQDIVKRGREHILESRANAKRFHATGSYAQAQRNFAFRVGNFFISTFSKR